MSLANFVRADDAVLKTEGGYSDRKSDPGGPTNDGVTLATARALRLDENGDGKVDILDIKAMTKADAAKVYKHFYWDAVNGDALPTGLDYAVFDFSVNSGCDRAARYLQHILGVTQDGYIGPLTLNAIRGRKVSDLITTLCDWRLTFLKALAIWPEYGAGLQARVDSVRATCLAWSAAAKDGPPALSPRPAAPVPPTVVVAPVAPTPVSPKPIPKAAPVAPLGALIAAVLTIIFALCKGLFFK